MKTCSYCGRENADTAVQCAECGTSFPVPEPVDPQLTESLVILATFGDTVTAGLLKDRLEQAGIEACIPEELDPSPFGNFAPLAHVTVRVTKKDLQAAQEVLSATAGPVETEKTEKTEE